MLRLGTWPFACDQHSHAPAAPSPRQPRMSVLSGIKRKALLLADVVASIDLRPFLKKHGIKDKRYSARLVEQLRTTFSLQPAARSGRPRKYTTEQLDAACEALASPAGPIHTTAALVQQLKDDGQLQPDSSKRGFMAALKQRLQQRGWRLAFGTRSKQQALTKADAKARLEWCREMRTQITEETVGSWYCEDEKMLSSGGKSRCEWGRWGRIEPSAQCLTCPALESTKLGQAHTCECPADACSDQGGQGQQQAFQLVTDATGR